MRFYGIILLCLFLGLTGCRSAGGKVTLNYLEYNRGASVVTRSSPRLEYGANDLRFHDVRFDDRSFFPDDSVFPNAFFKPLLRLQLHKAMDAFTEPYYGVRFIHFFKKNPRLGIGIDFIHFKIFVTDPDQRVRLTGRRYGRELNETVRLGDFIDTFSVSHGINHLSLTVVYRWLLSPSSRVSEGRCQPFVSLGAGPAIPHLELTTVENGVLRDRAYSYQLGFPKNLGFGLGAGVRFKLHPHFGLYAEYKFTYSLLHGMFFDGDEEGTVKMSFPDHHFAWGVSYIF